MTRKPINVAASVYNRLLQRARDRGEDFQLTLQRYAIERLLVRLSDRVRVEPIREREEYGGIRVLLEARLGNAHVRLRVDIGFGDVVVPSPKVVSYPTLLGSPAPRIRAYSRESVVAEKLHAAVRLGDANSRMKDFYDLYSLSRLFPFEGPTLTKSIAATFNRRRTALPSAFPLRSAFFGQPERLKQWQAYLKRTGLHAAPGDFVAVGGYLRDFLAAPYGSLVGGGEFVALWPPGGPWG